MSLWLYLIFSKLPVKVYNLKSSLLGTWKPNICQEQNYTHLIPHCFFPICLDHNPPIAQAPSCLVGGLIRNVADMPDQAFIDRLNLHKHYFWRYSSQEKSPVFGRIVTGLCTVSLSDMSLPLTLHPCSLHPTKQKEKNRWEAWVKSIKKLGLDKL